MAFDYKKEYKAFYLPPNQPELVTIPAMQFLAVEGAGDPNEPDGAYQHAMNLLYGLAFTIKMSKKTDHRIEGYFDYVVPPLEGLWRQAGTQGMDYTRKSDLQWISLIRLPDFVTPADFAWAAEEAGRKKKMDFSPVRLFRYEEGLCVQCMHLGAYDDEPETVARMDAFAAARGYGPDMEGPRYHHEIYLSDPRRTAPEKLRTVLRHPVKPL